MLADTGAGQGAVVVGVHEAGSQHPAIGIDGAFRSGGCAGGHIAQMDDPVTVDQRIAAVGLGGSVAGDDQRVGDQLPHSLTVSGPNLSLS